MLKLYDYFRSSACYRVRIAANLKELEYELVPIHLLNNGGDQFSHSYREINPQSLVPSLKDDEYILTQSIAIIEYLDEIYPSKPLLPKNPYERAIIRAFALSIAADIHPLNNLRVLTYLKNEFNISETDKNKWYQHWLQLGLSALELQLTTRNKHEFCFGDEPSLADVCLVPQLFNAKRFDCDLSQFPNLMRVDKSCLALKAFADAAPVEA